MSRPSAWPRSVLNAAARRFYRSSSSENRPQPPAACYILGTDTDVGKTVVTAGLLLALSDRGRRVQGLKPVQTGQVIDETIYGRACPEARIRTLRHFHLAASPHLSAACESCSLNLDQLADEISREAAQADFTLIEGAGGVCTPLNQTETFLDLMRRRPYPVILVIKNALGAINHSLLSLTALREAGLQAAGLVINQTIPPAADRQMLLDDNLAAIPAMSRTPLLGTIPYFEWTDRKHDPAAGWAELAGRLGPAAEKLLNLIREF